MKEKYEVGDYTLKLSAVGCHLTVWLKYCVTIVLPSIKVLFQNKSDISYLKTPAGPSTF